MSLALRKDDPVVVTTGKERGKTGKILKILTEKNRALVEKLNLVKKHAKPTKANPQGGIIQKEASIHLSNLMYRCGKCGKGVRTGIKILGDGKKVRMCRKCNEVLDKA
ncbi:MAG: 50S ribosomal protein L24 [Deltaproteobacteria bacterium]|nr:50S ribosomal protein L24 [Deltaproteobacteria bacterium]